MYPGEAEKALSAMTIIVKIKYLNINVKNERKE
jgi:hypothetical protein